MRVIGRAGSGPFGLIGFICLTGFVGLIGCFALSGLAQGASTQGAPIGAGPGPGSGQAQSYSIDQTRYFASPEVESAERKQRLAAAAAFPAVAPVGAAALVNYLRRAEVLLGQLERHNAYLHLRASRDMDDRADADADDKTADAIDLLTSTVEAALRTVGGAAFGRDAAANPALRQYTYLLVRAERNLAHELPKEQEAIIHELADPAASNAWTLYQQTVRSTPFAKLDTAEGRLDVRADARVLAVNPDRAIRQAAWQGRWDGYASRADIYAGILFGIVRLNDRVARLHHFPDAPSRVYFRRNLDRAQVAAALGGIESHAEMFKAYQRLRARHVAAFSGLADVRPWDWSLPTPGFVIPRMTLDQTRVEVLEALAPLGADYVDHFRQLLDPATGRMDIAAEQGKRINGGFSIGAPGVASGLFVENYGRGLIGDSRVIIHEGGHAIHKQLMTEGGVSPFYTQGPNWMFEGFAILNEFLLYDRLYRSSTDAKAQAYYLEALVDDMSLQLFTSAEEATLEQSIYDGVVAGRIKNAADLDALSLSVWSQFEIWPASEPQYAHIWATKALMYEDPLYLVNYLYAGLLATQMFDMAERDPSGFPQRYAELLRKGFQAAPEDLLRSFFGRSLSQQERVDACMNILQRRIEALGKTYKTIDAAH
jgi:oligoendopeptidase F